ncbi:hypothetical protein B0H15DRAFT_874921 [Mycena belliarum]|uniref:Uncharacterized protein n=1 Tax=Mycena belliarum TaxID=1033014 RepID=A0AAD6UHH1_9AGAR|nr:hypothetical protein B0H15DRAFT_874921 [Mycena belliae]
MATDARPPVVPSASLPSASFSASTSTTTASPARPLKRRLLSAPDLNFFVPAEDSFKPRPYTPKAPPAREAHPERVPVRPLASHALSTLGLDPLPTDPDVFFLRYPFTSFPDQHLYPEGVSYTTLAENLNWFLDPEDYLYENCTNPDAVPYPAALEPPRGWCPARKKDLKEKGPEGWPEGEQPRLRCTFCRRTYAGVNAKSMWRRHVFEKHKIAMANRRNDMERPRGRNSISNKENKRAAGKTNAIKKEGHEIVLNADAAASPAALTGDAPHPCPPSSPTSNRVIPPASPYDPLLTPSFRHSPPRLPSDQPWRFPSPSHPLHKSREFSLTMLGRDSPIHATPLVRSSRARASTPPASSPCASSLGFETPDSLAKIRPFPRSLFSSSVIHSTPPSSAECHARTSSDVDWTSSKPLGLLGSDQNPFIATWGADGEEEAGSPPSSSPEGESPVVRSGARPSAVGLGIGLLEPFILPDSCATTSDVDFDELMADEDDEAEVVGVLASSVEDPPLKRRRVDG